MDPETFRFAKLVVLWGANVLRRIPTCGRPSSRRARTARSSSRSIRFGRGPRLRATGTSRPMPGTDGALALGLLNVVLSERGEDREFIVNATVDERDSDTGGGAVLHDNRVRVDKTSA